jgi:hypothetical protein
MKEKRESITIFLGRNKATGVLEGNMQDVTDSADIRNCENST